MFNRFLYGLCLVWAGLFWSCKKDEKMEIPKDFPVNLMAERWEVRADTRLFTNGREITDAAVIRAFEENTALGSVIEESTTEDGAEIGLRFESELSASFYFPGGNMLFDVQRKGTRFLFYSQETYGVNPSGQPSVGSLGFLHNMLKYADRLGEAAPLTGLRQTREVRVAHGNYKVLKLSAFAYALRLYVRNEQGDVMRRTAIDGGLLNEFDADVAKFLSASDTLAVKEYSIICSFSK